MVKIVGHFLVFQIGLHCQLIIVVLKNAKKKYFDHLLSIQFFHHEFESVAQNVRQNVVKISGHPPPPLPQMTSRRPFPRATYPQITTFFYLPWHCVKNLPIFFDISAFLSRSSLTPSKIFRTVMSTMTDISTKCKAFLEQMI